MTAAIGIGNATGIELSASNISADTTSGDLEIDNVLGTSVNVTSLTTGSGSIDFDQSGGGSLVTGILSATNTIDVTNSAGDVSLAGTVASSDLVVTSSGAVTDGADGDLAISGSAQLTGDSIELGNDAGNTTNFGSLTFNSAGSVTISEDSSLDLVGVNTAGSADLDSTAAVSDAGATSVDITGLLDVSGTEITLGSGSFNAGTT